MRLGAFAVHDRSRAEFLLQLPHGGEMIRMGVGVDDEPHPQAAAVGQADITVGLSQRWIDDGRDAALFASYEIGLAALAVRDLLKEHAPPPPVQSKIGSASCRERVCQYG